MLQALAVVDSAVLLSFLPKLLLQCVWNSAIGQMSTPTVSKALIRTVYAYTFSLVYVATYWFRIDNLYLVLRTCTCVRPSTCDCTSACTYRTCACKPAYTCTFCLYLCLYM